jgi:internalin A
MSKPIQIIALEKKLKIVISEFSNSIFNGGNYFAFDESREVVSLTLSNNQISDIKFLKLFPFLKSLNLSYNEISDISNIKSLKKLESLNLSYNQVSDISSIGSLTNLKTLILNNNLINDASSFVNLSELNYLNLNENKVSELDFLCELPELLDLKLGNNMIFDIYYLENLKKIKSLQLNNNNLEDISVLEDLKELNFLNLSYNEITDISSLDKLIKLKSLNLARNGISNLDPLKNLLNLEELYVSNNNISNISFIENLIKLKSLDLGKNKLENISSIKKMIDLDYLDISNNLIRDINPISELVKISRLYLNDNKAIDNILALKKLKEIIHLNLSSNSEIEDFSVIGYLKKIKSLMLNNLIVNDFSFLKKLKNIEVLFLGSNKISDISFLENITSIKTLYLNFNQISSIDKLSGLKSLNSLYLQGNKISDISTLKGLISINLLDLTNNLILEIEQFEFISSLTNLNIRASGNPCFNKISLDTKNNNFDTILNYLKKNDESKRMYHLPAKVLFLGNTESGKSTLLDYILQKEEVRAIKNNLNSTHIVKIETLPKRLRKNAIPKAVFYDFGGQDYYHGLYKAFLSNDSINILLWNRDYDKNQIRKDREGQLTRDYNRNYWLNQLKFQYNKETRDKKELELDQREPVLLVQTRADQLGHVRDSYKGDCESLNIKNEFFISLSQQSIENSEALKIGLRYFEETLNDLIRQKQIIKKEPLWFKDFLNYILRSNGQNYTLLSDVALQYNRTSDPDNLLLPEVLRELAQTGLVLYYKDDSDLKDVVWLDPSKTIQYIHDSILSKNNIIKQKGIVDRNVLDDFTDHKLLKLLLNQKVIFFDEFDEQYIIPGYLCLTEEDDRIYELLTFDFIEPNFVMKFEYFIPFGLINQLICHYGKYKHKKYYWRDQLLFTKDNCKILIKLDFNNLEISVSIKSKRINSKLNNLEQSIFRDILNLYWDKSRLDENDINIENLIDGKLKAEVFHDNNDIPFYSPDDLYISIDNKNFVHHKTLENKELTINKIISFGLESRLEFQNEKSVEIRKIDKSKTKEQASGLYKNFTTNKNTETMKKIFISYAKENKKEVNEFQKQIAPFKLTKEVETWHCSELELGEDWNSKIKSKFYEADIVLYFVSTDFFSTPFILDEEVKRGIERDNDPTDDVVLIPIILEKIHWADLLGKYSSNFKGKEINSYDKHNNAWYEIVDDLKNHHFRKVDPNSTSSKLGQSKDKMKAQEDIIAGKL